MALLPAPAEATPIQGYRQLIARELDSNPEQVKQIFQSWLAEGQ
jgi:hypothetical protein